MIDLHTHTFFSDGVLVPSELARRVEALGLRALAFTDHADASNLEFILQQQLPLVRRLNELMKIKLLAGVELTHVPPAALGELIAEARRLGAELVVVHGETIVEPVAAGTNRAALEGGADILAHPGLITEEEVQLAARRGVALEISARKGNSLTNGHVAVLARRCGARLVVNSDAHEPADLITLEAARRVALGAGLSPEEFEAARRTSAALARL